MLSVSANSKLNLSDNDLILNYSGASPMSDVFAKIVAGRGATPLGIYSSMANASGERTTLAVAEASQALDISGAQTAMFSGHTVDATCILIKYTWAGDANLDGIVSGEDYAAIDFNRHVAGASGYYNGDLNYDGIVSGDDYATIDFMMSAQGAPL